MYKDGYKVGDKVRIASEKRGAFWNSKGKMDKWLGQVVTIAEIATDDKGIYCWIEEDGETWWWRPWMIEGCTKKEEAGSYKVGDKVRIVSKKVGYDWSVEMDSWLGKVVTISRVLSHAHGYKIEEDDGFWSWRPWMIEGLAGKTNPVIMIECGRVTTAQLFLNGRLLRTAKAKCSPEDVYDEKTGVKLAISRLLAKRYFSLDLFIQGSIKSGVPADSIARTVKDWAFEADGKELDSLEYKGHEIFKEWVEER